MSNRIRATGGWRLAVEVMSRPSRVYDREVKRPAYLALGVEDVGVQASGVQIDAAVV